MPRIFTRPALLPLLCALLFVVPVGAPARAARGSKPALPPELGERAVGAVLPPNFGARPVSATFPPNLAAALDNTLEMARLEAHAPGALLYVSGPSIGVYSGARGLANLATGEPLTPGARVRAASVTKPFVAVVTLQLVQEGWLLLDHTVEHWLPGLVPGGEQITVRHLLRHTSGLPDYLNNRIVGQTRRHPEHVWTPQELVAQALRRPRLFSPGEPGRWAYANTNYILLGMIIERITGNPLDLEIRQRITEPLGLRSTSLAPPNADPGDLARGYVGNTDYTALNMSVAWAAGGLTSTVDDLGQFMQATVWHRVLRPETQDLMLACEPTGGAWGVPDLAYGMGLMRRTLPAEGLPPEARLALGHTGALGGYRIAMWFFPASGVTIVAALTRFEADPNWLVTHTLETLAAHGAI